MDPTFTDLLRPFLTFAGAREITPESRLPELGLDSMQAIELLFAVEDTYGIALPDELLTAGTFETAGALWEAISQLSPALTDGVS